MIWKFIKDIVCTFFYILLGIICFAAWFILFALGYILQGTWEGVTCIAVNFAINVILLKLINNKDTKEE